MDSKQYLVFYSDRKKEDNIILLNMFENCKKIDICRNESSVCKTLDYIEKCMSETKAVQLIFFGLELGWNNVIKRIKQKDQKIKIKIICNTSEALLYYDYERNNFFEMLKLAKENLIENIAFLKYSQYLLYKDIGYNCSYLMQNYIAETDSEKIISDKNEIINIGIYPLNYTWDKNIFNQLCIGKFIEGAVINYIKLDNRMEEFLRNMKINSNAIQVTNITEQELVKEVIKNDIIVSCAFTDYFNPIFFISMENGIPCILGDTSDLFRINDDEQTRKLRELLVTDSEDNPIINLEILKKCLERKEEIIRLYKIWKNKYNNISKQNKREFLEI